MKYRVTLFRQRNETIDVDIEVKSENNAREGIESIIIQSPQSIILCGKNWKKELSRWEISGIKEIKE